MSEVKQACDCRDWSCGLPPCAECNEDHGGLEKSGRRLCRDCWQTEMMQGIADHEKANPGALAPEGGLVSEERKLTDDMLARLERHARSMHDERAKHKAGVLMSVDALEMATLVAEVRHLRALDAANSVAARTTLVVSAEEREALDFIAEEIRGQFQLDWPSYTGAPGHEGRAKARTALAALARLVEERRA